MTDRAALYRGILERPEDDLPRLVFADWLEDNGETELAACIRSLIVGGRKGFPVPEGEPAALWHDGRTIEIQPTIPGVRFAIHGGFVFYVRCTLADWVGWSCPQCNGTGQLATMPGRLGTCPSCLGQQRSPHAPAHGTRLVAEQPVESLALSDCKPDPGSGDVWFFAEEWIATMPDAVADEVDDLCWSESELAEKFLGRSLLNWARREASLPPLVMENTK